MIDGKALALKHEEVLKEEVKGLEVTPHVVSILIGNDVASEIYSRMKSEKAAELGFIFEVQNIPESASWESVTEFINGLNNDPEITGIMVQLPLPETFLKDHQLSDLLDLIDPQKDVDGLTTNSPFMPATVRGVMSILNSELGIMNNGKLIAVVGALGTVGRALVDELEQKGNQVIQVDKELPESSLDSIKEADVVISATGEKNLIKEEHVSDGVILIDVGLGDFDPGCYDKASAYTPIKGGVGPMTIISLMENIVESSI